MKIEKILVPVQFDDAATGLVTFAAQFAERVGASLTLLNVWYPPPFSPPETLVIPVGEQRQTLWEHVRKNAEKDLARLAKVAEEAGSTVTSLPVEYGEPATKIVDEASKGKFDLLILSTHGRRGLAHLALGSVAEKVVRRARCPVMVLPPRD